MKQTYSRFFFFSGVSFFSVLFFFSAVSVSMGAGVGQGELCTGGPTKSDCASGLICVDNMQGDGVKSCQVPGSAKDSSQRFTVGTSKQPIGAGCLYPTDCASGFCDGVTGKCVAKNTSSTGTSSADTSASPTPSAGSGSPGSVGNFTGERGGSTSANRAGVATAGAAAGGLYIPSGSEVGLSDMRISDLIQNLMNWLLYIIGFIAIIAFVISGIQYLLAGADEEMAKKGKENMQYAIIGVIIALSALIIIRAIQSVLSGAWIF